MKEFKELIKWFLLSILAIVLLILLTPVSLIIGIWEGIRWKKLVPTFTKLFKATAISVDMLGNVWLAPLLNNTLHNYSSNAYLHGKLKQTISYVMAKNWTANVFKKISWKVFKIVNWFDKGHFEKENI